MATTRIVNPRVYTKDSFYYQFVWEWEVINDNNEVVNDIEPDIDLNKEYEVKIYINDGSVYIPCNSNNLLIVKYNQPISVLTIENVCQGSNFTIPENCTKCKFVIREKKEGGSDEWSSFFPSTDFCLMPLPLNTMKLNENLEKNTVAIGVDNNLRNFLNESNNPFVQYYAYFVNNGNNISPSKNCFYQSKGSLNSYFIFNTYYNSILKLNTLYNIDTVYYRYNQVEIPSFDNQLSNYTTNIIPQQQYTLNYSSNIYNIDTPSKQGALIYVIDGEGWKVNNTSLEKEHTYNFLSNEYETLTFTSAGNNTSNLKINMYGHSIEANIDYNRYIQFTTGNKYTQQIEAFDDLKTIKPISDISNNEFTYQYDSINEHTPVFIYQKMIDNTYNLTNNLSNLNTGTLNTDFENISKNDLIVTTSPVMNYKYGAVSLNGNTYTHINVQDYKNFIISTIKIGSGIPSDHTSGYIQIAYDDDFSFENAQIVNNNDVINVENYNYVNIKFVRDIGSGSSIIRYFLEEEGEQSLKTSDITTEEIGEYTEEHAYMLNVNKVFNSLEEEFTWQTFNITQEKGQPKLIVNAQKNVFSDLYSYKVLIQNQMSNREIVNQELDFKYSNTTHFWCIHKNNIGYPTGCVLSDLVHNELSSKEKYHIIIKRIYNRDEYIIDERDVGYENNTDFFLAPFNNINHNPDEENDFYFSTERNNSENAAQGYPWLIYNNEDNASYFCYSNQAYNNNADNRGVDNYDSNKSDNKQLIHINYHDKPNFTPKEVIPMLDFKITELIKQQNPYQINVSNIGNQNNIKITSYSNSVTVSSNGPNASFTIKPLIENGYISFAGNSDSVTGSGSIEVLDKETGISLYASNNFSSGEGSYFLKDKKVNNDTTLLFKLPFSNSSVTFTNCTTKTLVQPDNSNTLLQKRKFYIDNFSINKIDYSQIENGSIISGQVLELHKPITLHIEDFTTNMSSNNIVYYKIEKVNEYNQEVITPIDDDNSITILQKDDNGSTFTKDFYINSHTNQLKIQNTKTKQITFNNAQKDTIVNCILEKEEVED